MAELADDNHLPRKKLYDYFNNAHESIILTGGIDNSLQVAFMNFSYQKLIFKVISCKYDLYYYFQCGLKLKCENGMDVLLTNYKTIYRYLIKVNNDEPIILNIK